MTDEESRSVVNRLRIWLLFAFVMAAGANAFFGDPLRSLALSAVVWTLYRD